MVASWRTFLLQRVIRLKRGTDTVLMKSTISWALRLLPMMLPSR